MVRYSFDVGLFHSFRAQWVLTVPYELRFRMARSPGLCSAVLRIFVRCVGNWYKRRAGKSGLRGKLKTGGVTVIQRFGSALALQPCVQATNDRGVFREIRRADENDLSSHERDLLLQQGDRVARALHTAGFFGPFGIDGHRHHDGEDAAFCALSEINARYTMGYLTGMGSAG